MESKVIQGSPTPSLQDPFEAVFDDVQPSSLLGSVWMLFLLLIFESFSLKVFLAVLEEFQNTLINFLLLSRGLRGSVAGHPRPGET